MFQGQIDEDSLEPRQSDDVEVNDALAARKVFKADREKSRRGKLNEHFLELGNLLDPDRPKNEKASIIADAIQELKDLNSEVKKLKEEHTVLCEESQELTQEKNELREEKASLKSNIQDLKVQHQLTQRFMVHPWASVDSPILITSPYSFPIALTVPPGPGPVPMHPTLQPSPFLANQHSASPGPYPTFIPYRAPVIPRIDQSTTSNPSTSYISGPRTSSVESSDEHRCSSDNKIGNSSEVATDLELKIPGSTDKKELSTIETGKQTERHHVKSGSCLNKSASFQASSSDSVDDL